MNQKKKKTLQNELQPLPDKVPDISDIARVYLETNLLRESSWPHVSTQLKNLFLLCSGADIHVFLIAAVELEIEQHRIREFNEKVLRFQNDIEKYPAGFRVGFNLTLRQTNELLTEFRKAAETNIATYEIKRVPFTSVDLRHLFDLSIRHTPPFEGHSSGFQDSIVLHNIFEHVSTFNDSKISVILTKDQGFLKMVAESGDRRIIGLEVDALVSKFREAGPSGEKNLLEQWKRETESAIKAVTLMSYEIDQFLTSNYRKDSSEEIFSGRRFDSVAVLNILNVNTPIPEPTAPTKVRNVQFSFRAFIALHSTTVQMPVASGAESVEEIPSIFSMDRFTVEIEATAKVEDGEYTDIRFVSVHRV